MRGARGRARPKRAQKAHGAGAGAQRGGGAAGAGRHAHRRAEPPAHRPPARTHHAINLKHYPSLIFNFIF